MTSQGVALKSEIWGRFLIINTLKHSSFNFFYYLALSIEKHLNSRIICIPQVFPPPFSRNKNDQLWTREIENSEDDSI